MLGFFKNGLVFFFIDFGSIGIQVKSDGFGFYRFGFEVQSGRRTWYFLILFVKVR